MAVAFYLAAVALLPLLLLIVFDETGLLVAHTAAEPAVPDGSVSNQQLQVTTLVACAWCGLLAMRRGPWR